MAIIAPSLRAAVTPGGLLNYTTHCLPTST